MSAAVDDAPASPPASRLKKILPLVIAAAAMAFVIWQVPFRDRCTDAGCTPGLLSTMRLIRADIAILTFVVSLFSTLVWAIRWRTLLGLANVEMSVWSAWRVTLEAQAGGVLLPGGVAGDALRIAYARDRARSASLPKIVASIFVDRVLGLVTLATLAAAAGFAFDPRGLGPALYFLAAIPIASAIGFAILRVPHVRKASIFSKGLAGRVVAPMLEYAADPRGLAVIGRSILLSLLVSALQLVVIRLFVLALGVTPEREGWVYVGSTLSFMVAALPLTPGSWGTADAAYVLFLGRAGIAAPVAAAVCLLYRVSWYACAVIGGALTILRRKS